MGEKPSVWSELYSSPKVRSAFIAFVGVVGGVIAAHYGLVEWAAKLMGGN